MKYKDELIRSMEFLAQDQRTIFIGQSVKFSGNAIFNTLESIDDSKKIETPVFEDIQMGFSTGLALNGFVPITCYPRFDFLIIALNQLVNHADKINLLTNNQFNSKIIIKVDPEKWGTASEEKRWYILYHELGHDVLNLEHGECGAMMNEYAKPDYTWSELEKDKTTMFESYKRLKQN